MYGAHGDSLQLAMCFDVREMRSHNIQGVALCSTAFDAVQVFLCLVCPSCACKAQLMVEMR